MKTDVNLKLPIYKLDYELIRTFENKVLKEALNKKEKKEKLKVNYVSITPDQKYVICGYTNGYITIFDYETNEIIKSFKAHSKKIMHIEFYEPENKILTCGADGKILIFDLNNFVLTNEIQQPGLIEYEDLSEIRFVLVSDEMNQIFFGSQNGCLFKCDKATNYKPYVYVNPDDFYPSEDYFVTSGVFSPDKTQLVYTSGYSIKFINLKTGKIDKVIGRTKEFINDIIFYPNNEDIVATWSENGTITYWDINLQEKLVSFSASNTSGYCHLAFDSVGRYIASGNDGDYVNIWDAVTKHPLITIKDKVRMDGLAEGHKGTVKSLLFTKNDLLLTGSFDGTAKLWKLSQKSINL